MKNKTRKKRNPLFRALVLTLVFIMAATSITAAANYTTKRIYGSNRFETANKIADEIKELSGVKKFKTVIVATGFNYPDALSGAYLAKAKNAPIVLLSNRESDTVKWLKKNLEKGGKVYLLGGTGVIKTTFTSRLNKAGIYWIRLGGYDRYETNLKILSEVGVKNKELIVTTGLDYPEALVSSATGNPVMIVGKSLTPTQKTFLAKNITKLKKITIVGDEKSVNATVSKQLKAYGKVTRIIGENDYEMSVLIAKRYFTSPKKVVLSVGTNYPDALSGGALAVKTGSPLILTGNKQSQIKYAKEYIQSKKIRYSYILGGKGLISEAAVKKIMS